MMSIRYSTPDEVVKRIHDFNNWIATGGAAEDFIFQIPSIISLTQRGVIFRNDDGTFLVPKNKLSDVLRALYDDEVEISVALVEKLFRRSDGNKFDNRKSTENLIARVKKDFLDPNKR